MFALNLFIILEETVLVILNNLTQQYLFYAFLFCLVSLCTRQKGQQKRKEGNLMNIVYF